jgi:AcrR family transcriptional regulator
LENDRKSQIIKAAVKRFSKHGLGKTTLDEIARDLRIGKATIYHYFISKEALFYRSIEWEGEQYVEEVKSIFENEGLPLRERFNSYFISKETIDQKYKLLYELFLLLMRDNSFEKEKEILKTMLRKEEIILEMALNPAFRKKEMKAAPSLPLMFVAISWGWLFGTKLNQMTNDNQLISKELLKILIENVLPDQLI